MNIKNKETWNPDFFPSYTPMEMVAMGVFMDCHYNYVIKNLPSEWYKQKNIITTKEDPDPTKNFFGVKSRQSLKTWQENGWTTKNSPLGWWEWYIKYYFGRRLKEEDDWQIGRWRSFVARHMGQIKANCKLKDHNCRPVQRQALLQWGWDSDTFFNDEQKMKNLKHLGIEIKTIKENPDAPSFVKWK